MNEEYPLLNVPLEKADYGKAADLSVLDQDIRDRNEYGGYVNVGYEFIPNYEAFIEFGADTRKYNYKGCSTRTHETGCLLYGISKSDKEAGVCG